MSKQQGTLVENKWKQHLHRKKILLQTIFNHASNISKEEITALIRTVAVKIQELRQLRSLNHGLSQQLQKTQKTTAKNQELQTAEFIALQERFRKIQIERDDAVNHAEQLETNTQKQYQSVSGAIQTVEQENAALKQQLAAVQQQFESEKRRSKQSDEALKASVMRMQAKCKLLEKDLATEREQSCNIIERSRKQLEAKEKEKQEISKTVWDITNESQKVKEMLNQRTMELQHAQHKVDSDNEHLRSVNQQAHKQIESLQRSMGGTISALQKENENLQAKLAETQSQHSVAMSALSIKLKETQTKLKSTSTASETSSKEAASHKRVAREASQQLQLLKQKTQSQIQSLKTELANTEDQMFQDSERFDSTLTQKNNEIAALKSQIMQVEQQQRAVVQQAEQNKDKASTSGQQLVEAHRIINERQAEIDCLKDQVEELMAMQDEASDKTRDLNDKVSADMKRLTQNIESLSRDLQIAQEAGQTCAEKLQVCQQERDKFEAALGRAQQEIKMATAATSRANAELRKQELDSIDTTATLTKQLKAAKKSSTKEVLALKKTLQARERALENAKEEKTNLLLELATQSKKLKEIKTDANKKGKVTENREKQIMELKVQLELANRKSEELQQHRKRAEKLMRNQASHAQEEATKLTKQVEHAKAQAKMAQRKAVEQVAEISQRISTLERENKVLTGKYESAKEDIKRLRSHTTSAALTTEQQRKDFQMQVAAAQGEQVRLKKALKEQRAERAVVERNNVELANQLQDKSRRNDSLKQAVTTAEVQKREAQQKLALIVAQVAKSDESILDLRAQNKMLHEAQATIARERDDATAHLIKLQAQQKQHDRQQLQLEDRHARDVARLNNDLRKTKALLTTSTEEVAAAENKLSQVKEASKKTLQDMSTEFQRHEETNNRLRKEIMALQKRVKTAEEQSVRTEESSTAISDKLRVKADTLQQSLSSLQQEHTQLQNRMQPLAADLSECKKQLAASIAEAKAQADQSEIEKAQLTKQLRQVSTKLAETTGHSSVNEKRLLERANELKAELKSVQAKALWQEDDLNMQLNTAQTELRDTTEKLQRKSAKVKTMKERIASLAKELAQSKKDANANLLQLRQQLAKNSIADDLLGDSNHEEVERLTQRLTAMTDVQTELQDENREQKKIITKLRASVKSTQMALEQTEDKCASLQVSLQSMHEKQENRTTSSVDADAQLLIQNLRADVKSCKDRIAKLRKSKESLQAEYEEEIQQLHQELELAKSATQWKSDMKMAMMQFDDVPAVVAEKPLVKTEESNQSLTQDLISFSETGEPKGQKSRAVTSREKPKTAAAQSIESVERYLMKRKQRNKKGRQVASTHDELKDSSFVGPQSHSSSQPTRAKSTSGRMQAHKKTRRGKNQTRQKLPSITRKHLRSR